MSTADFVENLRVEATRVGYGRSMQRSLYSVANKYMQIRRIDIIHLTREFLAPLDAKRYENSHSRMASEAELLAMRDQGTWAMTDVLIEAFRKGDSCLLSFVGNAMAGYTWVNASARPVILPGLQISLPNGYLYNYAGFTLPAFRGFGLQPYRHHQLLNRPEWSSIAGMIGYVECTNWSSKKGQAKSGYQKLGELTLLGRGNHFIALSSVELKRQGIRRIHA